MCLDVSDHLKGWLQQRDLVSKGGGVERKTYRCASAATVWKTDNWRTLFKAWHIVTQSLESRRSSNVCKEDKSCYEHRREQPLLQ